MLLEAPEEKKKKDPVSRRTIEKGRILTSSRPIKIVEAFGLGLMIKAHPRTDGNVTEEGVT